MQHLVGLHAYGVRDVPPGSEPDEQRKKMDPDRESSSTTTCVWWRTLQCPMSLNPVCRLQTWEPHQREREGERRREKSTGVDYPEIMCKKVHPSSPFIIGGGVPIALPPPCGTKPHKGGSWPATHGPRSPWRPPSPLFFF